MRAGSVTGVAVAAAAPSTPGYAPQTARIVHALEGLRRTAAENAAKGTLASIRERVETLKLLVEAHELDEGTFPAQCCVDLWEELVGAQGGGAREKRRTFCRLLGSEDPRQEDIRLLALAPGEGGSPAFKFPDTFDLSSPIGYCQTVVVPKQDRTLPRLQYIHRKLCSQQTCF